MTSTSQKRREEKLRKLVRAFFNTFYHDVAASIVDCISKLETVQEVKVNRSKVVPELYYVEVTPKETSPKVVEEVERCIKEFGKDLVFGIKVYATYTGEGKNATSS